MFWYDFAENVILVILGMGIWSFRSELKKVWKLRKDLPYSWECSSKNCRFAIRANNRDVLDYAKEYHINIVHRHIPHITNYQSSKEN